VVSPVRLGAVSYLNAAPLVYGLAGDPAFQLTADLPSRVAERLHAGTIDVGMIPSIEYARGDYAIVPGIAIGSRGPVRSVSLYLRGKLDQVRRVALDTSSRTSVALARILIRERLGRDPEYVDRPPNLDAMLREADAALVIGDPALYADTDAERLDLGEGWQILTGLPFVFAFWAGRTGVLNAGHVSRLQAALRSGLQDLPRIALSYNGHGAGHAELNESYLRSNIVYALGPEELAGLTEFYRRAHRQGIIPRVPELRFHGGS
jgi:chorismate dehydratase